MLRKKILFICGSLNQAAMMHKISRYLGENELYFTPFYSDGLIKKLADAGFLDFSNLGRRSKVNILSYLRKNNLKIDYEGRLNNYDLVFTCSDKIIQNNIKDKKIILVQEGMTNPDSIFLKMIKYFKLLRIFAGTAATGQSHSYNYFCVASKGYRDFFISKGLDSFKVVVTGIPNVDNYQENIYNKFPYKNYILALTSDVRETFKYGNLKKFIKKCLNIAGGRQLIFKLHPNENAEKAIKAINNYAPGSIIFTSGNINNMVANCDVLVTNYSSVIFSGLALKKEIYSDKDIPALKKMMPMQNNGQSAKNIAIKARELLREKECHIYKINKFSFSKRIKNIKEKALKVA
jgi:hypothetical protein